MSHGRLGSEAHPGIGGQAEVLFLGPEFVSAGDRVNGESGRMADEQEAGGDP